MARRQWKAERFVYELPVGKDGTRTFIAIDSKGHQVDEQDVPAGFETRTAIADLWAVLRQADPKPGDVAAAALRLVK